MSGGSTRPRVVRVRVRLKGILADRFPGGQTVVEVEDGLVVERLVEKLELPPTSYVFVLNGKAVARGATLHDGDIAQVFPPMAGGEEPRPYRHHLESPELGRDL